MKLICILLTLLVPQSALSYCESNEILSNISQEKALPTKLKKEWTSHSLQGVPFWVALNSTPALGTRRDIFLFIEKTVCTKENIYKIFSELAQEYNSPTYMNIYVFSDREMLQRTIEEYQIPLGYSIFDNNLKGDKLTKILYGDPKRSLLSYSFAHYFRSLQDNEEWFEYSPDIQAEKVVTVIIKAKPTPIYTGRVQSDLILAVEAGDVEKLLILIEQGAKINEVDANEETVLFYAVRHKSIDAVSILIEKGAYIERKNKYGQTALIEAITHNNNQIVQRLIDAHANVNAHFGIGISALMLAAYKNNTKIVKALLSSDADVNVSDRNGITALMRAVENRNPLMVESLLKKGADVKVRNVRGETALMLARKKNNNNEVVELLLAAGAKE